VPLESHQVIVSLVGSTRTAEGLEVHCRLDEKDYPKGRKITDAEMAEIDIRRNAFHGEWNYEIKPR
ncbi:MAG: ISAzo13-like element transposase-related protein, partial [Planctomycetia bacterium]